MKAATRLAATAGLLLVMVGLPACASASAHPTRPGRTAAPATPATAATAGRTAQKFGGTPTVGALFPSGALPLHVCSASVVLSANKSVILTAAHCVMGGHDAGYVFAPGYHDGKAPYGFWKVKAAYGAPGWVKHTKSRDDFAFLVLAPRMIHGKLRKLQTVTGANILAGKPRKGATVSVPGYPLGVSGSPIHCRAKVFYRGIYPGFHCGGYVDGTSGSPWLETAAHGRYRRVAGLIGGLHQGGCQSSTSYSPPFGAAVVAALYRAGHDKPGDDFPQPPGDGC